MSMEYVCILITVYSDARTYTYIFDNIQVGSRAFLSPLTALSAAPQPQSVGDHKQVISNLAFGHYLVVLACGCDTQRGFTRSQHTTYVPAAV